jgi:predicted dehydrogenase
VKELVRDGAIGEPNFMRSSFSFVIDPLPPSGPNVRLSSELEGGSLMDIGCYGVNAARFVFDGEPVAAVGQQAIDLSYGVETTFAGVLRFTGDRLASIDSSFARGATNTYAVEGPAGSLLVERAFRPDTDPGRIRIIRPGKDPLIDEVPAANQFANEVDHFARSVASGRLLPPAEDGVAQARVVEALYASAGAGRTITLA